MRVSNGNCKKTFVSYMHDTNAFLSDTSVAVLGSLKRRADFGHFGWWEMYAGYKLSCFDENGLFVLKRRCLVHAAQSEVRRIFLDLRFLNRKLKI